MNAGDWKYLILIFFVGELIATLLYFLISQLIHKGRKDNISSRSILKGMVERLFLLISFAFGFSQSLIVFGALKIATRIRDEEDQVSNDYFLIGNLVSVLLAIIYFKVWEIF